MEHIWGDTSGICRLCLCEGDEILIPASEIIDCPSAVENVERCTGIRIIEEKNISYSICEDCSSKLKSFTAFRSFCLSNDTQFRKWFPMAFKNVSNDSEPDQQEVFLLLDRYHPDKTRNNITDHVGCIVSCEEPSQVKHVEKIEYLEIENSVTNCCTNDNDSPANEGELEINEAASEVFETRLSPDVEDDSAQDGEEEEEEELQSTDETIEQDHSHNLKQSVESKCSVSTFKLLQPGSEKSTHKMSQKQLCPICGKMVHDISDHKLSHTNEKKYACPHCSMAYGRKAYLKFHVQSVHQKKVVKTCEICNRDFAYKTGYDAHMRARHNVGKWYECKPCDMKFRHPGGLRAHKNRKHNDESNCECPICGMVFLDKMGLRNHARVHSSEKMFACKYCPKRFRSPNAHRGHELIHLGVTFPCPHCPKSYRYKQNLKVHLSKHYT